MMATGILAEILAHKNTEIAAARERYPAKLLEESAYFTSPTVSLVKYLRRRDKVGIIAEIKRRSPSKGVLNERISVEALSIGYMQAGASALSVLTDKKFFGGTPEDLRTARKFNFCPILRKDFIIDEYQIVEARSVGADAILLIAAALAPERLRELATAARGLGLETLLEVHSEAELESHLCPEISVVGVNNRSLADFSVSLETSFRILPKIPAELPRIAESGVHTAEDFLKLKSAGFDGALIGEAFMKTSAPADACARFIASVRKASEGT